MLRYLAPLALASTLPACGPDAARPPAEPALVQPEFRELQGQNRYVMIIPANLPADEWKTVAKNKCGPVEFCQIYGWTDPTEAPQTFPMTDREVETQAFFYGVNRVSGFERAAWDCTVSERAIPDECL